MSSHLPVCGKSVLLTIGSSCGGEVGWMWTGQEEADVSNPRGDCLWFQRTGLYEWCQKDNKYAIQPFSASCHSFSIQVITSMGIQLPLSTIHISSASHSTATSWLHRIGSMPSSYLPHHASTNPSDLVYNHDFPKCFGLWPKKILHPIIVTAWCYKHSQARSLLGAFHIEFLCS